MEGSEWAQPALLAAALSGSLHMCQSSFAEDIIINPCERWQMKTIGIKVHHIITRFSVKLPPPPPFSLVILTSQHLQQCSSLAYSLLVHPSKHTFPSRQPSKGTCPSQGGVGEARGLCVGLCPHFSFYPCLSLLSPPRQLSFTLYVPLLGLPTTKSNM